MKLKEIIPEYRSKNLLVRKLFLTRLKVAFQLALPELRDGLRVVDLGCGEGVFLKKIETEFKNIRTFGVDIEPNIVKLKNFLRAKIKVTDIKNTGFPDNYFDIAFCLDVLEHFKNLEKPTKEIKRIIKPGSLLVVSLPSENFWYKLGRFLSKGTISKEKGPYCGFNFSPHFHKAKAIEKFLLSKEFKLVERRNLPGLLPLFYIASFRKG